MKSTLPDDESQFLERLKYEGPLVLDGKEWFLDEAGHLHYRTIPTINGRQLGLHLQVPFPHDSLFTKASSS